MDEYLEEELRPAFGGLIQFVKFAEVSNSDLQKVDKGFFLMIIVICSLLSFFWKSYLMSTFFKSFLQDEFEKISNDFAKSWMRGTFYFCLSFITNAKIFFFFKFKLKTKPTAILTIKQNVSASFSDPQSSSNILQGVLAKLLSFYSRFLVLVEKKFGRTSRLPFREDPISVENVKFEIKKLRPQLQEK